MKILVIDQPTPWRCLLLRMMFRSGPPRRIAAVGGWSNGPPPWTVPFSAQPRR